MIPEVNIDPFLLFFGTFYMVLGLSAFFAQKAWIDFMKIMSEADALNLVLGVLLLPVSLFIVVFYNNWMTLGSTVLMTTGYLGLFISMVLLTMPKIFKDTMKKDFVRKWLWLDGLSGLVLGGVMILL